MLKDVGSEDFDEDDLKTQDNLVKRSDIIRKAVHKMKQESLEAGKVEKEKEDLKRILESERRDKERLKEEMARLTQEMKNRENDGYHEKVVGDLQKRLEAQAKETEIARETIRIRDQDIVQKNKDIEDLQVERTKLIQENKDKEKKIKELDKKADEAEKLKEQTENMDKIFGDRENNYRGIIDDQKKEIEALKKKVKDLEDDRKRQDAKIDDLEVAHKKQINDLVEDKARLERDLKEARERMAKIEKIFNDKDSILQKIGSQIGELNRTRSQMDLP